MFEVRDRLLADHPNDPNRPSPEALNAPEKAGEASEGELVRHRHSTLMSLLEYEAERQAEERLQMQIDEDYYDHLQWRPEDARILMERGQAPLVFNESRQTIDWIAGTEKRMRKDYKILPREPDDEQGAELKTKLVKYTDDVNLTQWHRSKAFKQAATAGLSWLEEGVNRDPEQEIIYSGMEDWRNVYRDSHSRNIDYNVDARYLFRRRVIDLDYATMLLPDSAAHLRNMAGRHEDQDLGDDIWYLGEKLTGASETEWTSAHSVFGARAAYMSREGYRDNSTRRSVELNECWYKVPERVPVYAEGPLAGRVVNPADPMQAQLAGAGLRTYEAVKFRMRLMIATREAPCLDMASPMRHGRFLLVPIFGYRRARDGLAYGAMRGMRDIQDDLNKRRSKALYALSVNRIVMDEGAVDDPEETRQEAARPDGIIIKKANKALTFEKNMADFQANAELAAQDSQLLRNAGGVTNENLGRDTSAQSGKAIGLKQDQGSLTTSELFDNLLLAIRQAGRLRLSHIEQFWTEQKAIRIAGERKPIEWLEINKLDPATGAIINDITAREADFIVDTQDYRASLAQAALDNMFELLGKIATFAPQVVVSVLDLVVETAELKDKEEWVARIRKLNGQRDPSKPPTPEEQQAEQAAAAKQLEQEQIVTGTAKANLEKLQADIAMTKAKMAEMDVGAVLKRCETLLQAMQAAQIVAMNPGVAPAADEIAKSSGFVDMHEGDVPVVDPQGPAEPPLPAIPESPQPEPVEAAPFPTLENNR
ncbi:portal protein [Pseudorhodoferax aquiterrae]|uniref:Portal protein n=1 Tax=Pseudorhodoferax aquiterrae TaxID=747304 RepID=A0ABQ3FX36_9BURK|nr:portal protein [Pseudorhodoferax aquiterrae]GHC72682.1 portal protein [Pseudorhodoferax aquiterrae]